MLRAVGVVVLLTVGYVLGVLRTISPHTRSSWDNRAAVWLGNWYLKVLRWGAELSRKIRLHK